jgi:superfamily I DNA/RNA helicase
VDTDGKRAIELSRAACHLVAQDERRRVGNRARKTEELVSARVLSLLSKVHSKLRELSPKEISPADALDVMQRFDLLPDDNMVQEDGATDQWVADRASKAAELAKQQSPTIDFADMIFLPLACGMVRSRYNLVVVDEAQDMTESQLDLAIGACFPGGRVAIVGDDRQAIYGFRGADSGSLDRLKESLQAAELGLTTTYRCPKRVVDIASRLVPDFRAASSAPEGVVEECSDVKLTSLAGPRDFVLSRSNAPLIKVCLSFLRQGKRAYVKGRDVGAGITALVDRQRARSISELSDKLRSWHARESKKASKLLPAAAEARMELVTDQLEVCQALVEDSRDLGELRAKLARLFSEGDLESVMCSTTHRAKGLEAENVYLLEGTFRGFDEDSEPGSEEQNIVYVAVTRAKRRLVWVSGFERKRRGEDDGQDVRRSDA